MTFQLSPVDLDNTAEFSELIAVQTGAHEAPRQPIYFLYCPIRNGNRDAHIQETSARFLKKAREDPHERWFKVVDTTTGRIAAAALWKIHDESPFAHEDEEDVDWWPENSTAAEFTGQMLEQLDAPRKEMGSVPQVFLNMLFVDEAYRRKGVGSMLLKWGIDTAKKMDVEGWLNATLLGKPLYEKFGFEVVKENQLVPKKENPNEKWKELEAEVCGGDRAFCVFWAMRLPREDSRSRTDDAVES